MFPRSSGGKSGKSFGRWGSLKDRERRNSTQGTLGPMTGGLRAPHNPARLSADSDSGTECVQTFQRAALYILGEKAQMKVKIYSLMYTYQCTGYDIKTSLFQKVNERPFMRI